MLIAVLAVHVLALGGSAVGWLTAAFGAGGLAGGTLAAAAVSITWLGRNFIAGICVVLHNRRAVALAAGSRHRLWRAGNLGGTGLKNAA